MAYRRLFNLSFPMRFLKVVVPISVAVAVTGCGHIPDAKLTYFSTQTSVAFKVIRTVMCDSKDIPIVANTVTSSVTHKANHDEPHTVSLANLRGTFSNSDFKLELTEDGRLSSVNASTTGQGEAILKTISTLSSTLVPFAAQPFKTYSAECAFIKEVGGGKPISVTYEGSVDPTREGQGQTIPPDASGKLYVDRIGSAIGGICAVVVSSRRPASPSQYKATDDELLLKVRQPGWAEFAVRVGAPDSCRLEPSLWSGLIPVAQLGVSYDLPIPRPATFGKQVFSATFAESGALKSVQYASETGAAQTAGALNSLVTIAQGETLSQKLAEVKGEADLIAQQQRLVSCLADPKSCK